MIEKSHFLPCNLPHSVIPGGGEKQTNKKKQLKSSVYVFRFLFNFYN